MDAYAASLNMINWQNPAWCLLLPLVWLLVFYRSQRQVTYKIYHLPTLYLFTGWAEKLHQNASRKARLNTIFQAFLLSLPLLILARPAIHLSRPAESLDNERGFEARVWHHLIDQSASMRFNQNGQSLFDRAMIDLNLDIERIKSQGEAFKITGLSDTSQLDSKTQLPSKINCLWSEVTIHHLSRHLADIQRDAKTRENEASYNLVIWTDDQFASEISMLPAGFWQSYPFEQVIIKSMGGPETNLFWGPLVFKRQQSASLLHGRVSYTSQYPDRFGDIQLKLNLQYMYQGKAYTDDQTIRLPTRSTFSFPLPDIAWGDNLYGKLTYTPINYPKDHINQFKLDDTLLFAINRPRPATIQIITEPHDLISKRLQQTLQTDTSLHAGIRPFQIDVSDKFTNKNHDLVLINDIYALQDPDLWQWIVTGGQAAILLNGTTDAFKYIHQELSFNRRHHNHTLDLPETEHQMLNFEPENWHLPPDVALQFKWQKLKLPAWQYVNKNLPEADQWHQPIASYQLSGGNETRHFVVSTRSAQQGKLSLINLNLAEEHPDFQSPYFYVLFQAMIRDLLPSADVRLNHDSASEDLEIEVPIPRDVERWTLETPYTARSLLSPDISIVTPNILRWRFSKRQAPDLYTLKTNDNHIMSNAIRIAESESRIPAASIPHDQLHFTVKQLAQHGNQPVISHQRREGNQPVTIALWPWLTYILGMLVVSYWYGIRQVRRS